MPRAAGEHEWVIRHFAGATEARMRCMRMAITYAKLWMRKPAPFFLE